MISLHDVMPETFDSIRRIIHLLTGMGLHRVQLLVVPGCEWESDQLETLHQWQRDGHELVAHGWSHRVNTVSGIYHCLHARLLSKTVAEHLALRSRGIRELMERSAAWFDDQGFGIPALYVPPAWALGRLKASDRRQLPFQKIEILRGYLDVASGSLERVGLMGYEVDNSWRYRFVLAWNRFQYWRSLKKNRPLRLSIHPYDFELRAARELWSDLTWVAERGVE